MIIMIADGDDDGVVMIGCNDGGLCRGGKSSGGEYDDGGGGDCDCDHECLWFMSTIIGVLTP